ncbi:hypothetical protein KY284_010428 [Solanum tuberosum]|nr:hypothetical protein KY284_010428 [Solanum tuberosum]
MVSKTTTAPSGGFYVIEGDEGIRTLENLLSDNFKVVNYFAVDNYEEELGLVPNTIHYHKCDNVIEVGTDCDSSEEEENGETVSSEYDSEELESYKKQKELDINEKLDKYKDLEYGMTFSNLKEAKQDGRDQGFKIKTLNQEHTCYETSENRRAKAGILSQYFKKKVQNNPALRIKDMKEHLDSVLDLDVNESKLKRVKRLVLDKLDGSYADDYNKLEAYAHELRMSNPGTDVMNMLRKHEAEVKSWKNEFSPHAMHLFNDYRVIAQRCKVEFNGGCGYEVTEGVDRHTINIELKICSCRVWDLSGIPCPHAIKAFIHKKIDHIAEIHWWYSKEAYLMVYKHKIEPVRGEIFWKMEPHHAMEPPTLAKMVGRPKMKRTREKDEAKNRQGVWSASRKGMLMTCGYCGEPNHNRRKCPLLNDKHKDVFQDEENSQESHNVPLTESENTQESVCFFIPVPASSQISSQTSIVAGHDSDPTLYPKVVSESNFRLHERLKKINTGTRKMTFQGDHDGVSIPTNLPYSPKKVTWKGKEAMTSNQLQATRERKIGKLKPIGGKGM